LYPWIYMFGQLWWPGWPGDAGAGLEPCVGVGLEPWAGAVGDALGPTSGAGVGVAANAAIENAMTAVTAASGPASSSSSRVDIWTSGFQLSPGTGLTSSKLAGTPQKGFTACSEFDERTERDPHQKPSHESPLERGSLQSSPPDHRISSAVTLIRTRWRPGWSGGFLGLVARLELAGLLLDVLDTVIQRGETLRFLAGRGRVGVLLIEQLRGARLSSAVAGLFFAAGSILICHLPTPREASLERPLPSYLS
jgi:hypothetical protein